MNPKINYPDIRDESNAMKEMLSYVKLLSYIAAKLSSACVQSEFLVPFVCKQDTFIHQNVFVVSDNNLDRASVA